MTVDELLANSEKYEEEKKEFLSLIKQKLENNVSENNYLTSLVSMTEDEFNNYFYIIKENELNKEIFKAKVDKDDHNVFSNFITTLFSMVVAFIAGILSANIYNTIEKETEIKLDCIVCIVVVFLFAFALITILVYRFSFYKWTLSCSDSIKSKYSNLEDLKLNKK